MKEITLTKGKMAIVDDEDFEWLSKFKWQARHDGCSGLSRYASRGHYEHGRQITILMHREIMKVPAGIQVDHINNNGFDNRRSNLRAATQSQNRANAPKYRTGNPFKGVRRHGNKWRSIIKKNGIDIRLGDFVNPVDAAKAYDAKAKEIFGAFALTNFREVKP